MAEHLLRVANLTRRFGGLVATDNLSMEVTPGELHAIIGPNGAGKTTLISQLTGQLMPNSGTIHFVGQDITALVIQQPNFFGVLEEVDELTRWARRNGAFVIAAVNPTSLALLKPPGEWGDGGVDIVCGEGQPLGVPLSSGGPYFGFMTTRRSDPGQ